MPRFVILHHRTSTQDPRAEHWDLMLEEGDELLTWALNRPPTTSDAAIKAQRLAPHRLHYLNYEGPLSRDRGTVSKWEQGEFEWRSRNPRHIAITLRGERLFGNVLLEPCQDGWLFRIIHTAD